MTQRRGAILGNRSKMVAKHCCCSLKGLDVVQVLGSSELEQSVVGPMENDADRA